MKNICLLILLAMCSAVQSIASKDVVITVLDKTKGASYLTFSQLPKFLIVGTEYFDYKAIGEKHTLNDSVYTVTIHTVKPEFILCNWLNNFEKNKMIITPGDRVKAVVKYTGNNKQKFEVFFSGKMKENYNTYHDLSVKFNKNSIGKMSRSVPLQKYVQIVDSAYTSNCQIIKSHIKSNLLRNFILNEEKAQVFNYLALAYASSINRNKLTWSELTKIKNKYFPLKISCENTMYLYNWEYTGGMSDLQDLLCNDIKSKNSLAARTDTIQKYFSGGLADDLIADNFYLFSKKAYKEKENISEHDVEKWYDIYSEKIHDKDTKALIQYAYDMYKKINHPFQDAVLNEKLIKLSDNSVLTFGDLLKDNKGSQIIIDTWASWCGSCIGGIKRGGKDIEELEKRGNHFIYLSIDKQEDVEKAREKAKFLNVLDKAYLIIGNDYVKYLDIRSIPRFVMVDKNGYIKNLRLISLTAISNFDK